MVHGFLKNLILSRKCKTIGREGYYELPAFQYENSMKLQINVLQ